MQAVEQAQASTGQEKVRLTISAQAEQYVRRDAPLKMRRMASRGAVPLPPIELVTMLFALLHDPDEEVKSNAKQTIAELPDGVCSTTLSGQTHPAVLAYLAKVFKDNAEHTELLSLNPETDDKTITFLATLPHRRVVEIIAQNQTRMLRCPKIVDAIGGNPCTSRSMIDRILSFMGLGKPEQEMPDTDPLEVELEPETITDENAEAALRAILGDDTSDYTADLIQDTEEEVDEEQFGSLASQVQNMSIFQKVKLARMGNKEARSILIREHNKIVATAAIRSPKITDSEVAGYAKQRGLTEEVYRIIACNREWTKNYQVKLALVSNPKCPIRTSMSFLNHLQDKDLKAIMKSREVSGQIAAQAKRILVKKGKA